MIIRRDLEYSTSFVQPAENPLSQGGRWRNGLTHAVDWCNVQVTGGMACGTQSGTIGPPYNDSIAVLDAPAGQAWSANQEVIQRVRILDRTGWNSFKEVECILRCTMVANSIKLYEVLFSVVAGTTYAQIMRWGGPVGQSIGDFEEIGVNNAFGPLTDKTFVRGRIINNAIEGATSPDGVNWTTVVSGNILTDAADRVIYPAGSPGVGFWNREPTNGANTTFGIDYFMARNLP